jgi:hypothetical protein
MRIGTPLFWKRDSKFESGFLQESRTNLIIPTDSPCCTAGDVGGVIAQESLPARRARAVMP